MPERTYNKKVYGCEEINIDVYFEFNNSIVYSKEKEVSMHDCLPLKKCREIVILTDCEIEQYDGISEIDRYCRSQTLIIQGIISFFTGFPLTMYNCYESSSGIGLNQYCVQGTHLIINDVDFTSDLIKMIERIKEEPQLTITLLDRWRKAVYLKSESCYADLYCDESTLNFFHIFELFGECYAKELKNTLENNIENMLEKHFQSFYFNDIQVKDMIEQNKKSVNSILIGDKLSLSVKIKYFLQKYELLDDNVSYFVDSMIKVRNAIAHGRITYHNKFIWPLSPFFNLAKDSYENIEFLFFMTAIMISKYVGINCWQEEWEEAKVFLLPPKYVLDNYIDNKISFDDFAPDMLFDGNKYNLTWRTIFNHYIKNPKKAFLKKIEEKLKDCFVEMDINKEKAPDIFNISLLFSDSDDSDIKDKAIENIKVIISNRWYGWSNFKDAYSYLDFYDVDLKWYKEFLDAKE